MRQATVLFLPLVFCGALAAQPCDPAQTGEVCPDTTDWHRYVPLEVGNQWQYRDAFAGEPVTHWSWRVVGETEVDGVSYFEIERCDETENGGATCADPALVRYDDTNAMLVRRDGDGEVWWDEVPCRLDVAFNDADEGEAYTCTGPGTEGATFFPTSGAYGVSASVPPDEVESDTRKAFSLQVIRDWEVFAGLGVTKFFYELQGEPSRLVHAVVGGEQVGRPAFATCDPADPESDIACPDTTDWRRYFPLDVGNEWQYREPFSGYEVYWGRRITGEVEIEGRTYFEIERCDESEGGDVTCSGAALVRYSDEYPSIVRYTADGDVGWGTCLLDIPFGGIPQTESGFYECEEGMGKGPYYLSAMGEYGSSVGIGPDAVAGDTRKSIGTPAFTGTVFYAGIGPIEYEDELHPDVMRLVYARISGDEVGARAFAFPTSFEPSGGVSETFALRDVYPNPARLSVTATYTLDRPQAVKVEVADVLGRVVVTKDLGVEGGGPHEIRFETGSLAPGVYVLRLRGDGAEATRRVVVLR